MNYLIDPYDITNFNRNKEDMELLAVFCCCVAGKTARIMAKMVENFFLYSNETGTPFEQIIKMHNKGTLKENLMRAKTGKYDLLTKGLYMLASNNINLYQCSSEDLEKIPGIGMKTSRFFILHSRKDTNIAVIDTHLLKYLRHMNVSNVPDTIPKGKEYLRLEKIILEEAKRLTMTPQELDLKTWTWYSNKNEGPPPWIIKK